MQNAILKTIGKHYHQVAVFLNAYCQFLYLFLGDSNQQLGTMPEIAVSYLTARSSS